MKTLITYCSSHGCTEKVAGQIRNFLGEDVILHNLKSKTQPLLNDFDRVIIGGSIHAGQIQKKIRDFCAQNSKVLLDKELGLFICCMEEGEKAEEEFRNVFPEELRKHAKATACLGGEFNFEKMNFLERMIIRKVAKVNHSVSNLNQKAIRQFSQEMNTRYQPFFFII